MRKFFNLLSYLLYLFKRVQHKPDAFVFFTNIFVLYSFLLNTNQNPKNNSQCQYEPIFWKLNSILNDSVLSVYVLFLIYTYILYNYKLKITSIPVVILLYFYLQAIKIQLIFANIIKIATYNTTLFNGLLLIHPVCLYLSYAYIIYIYVITKKYNNSASEYFATFSKYNKNFLTFSVIALLLGCWWAQQEVSWGGWWNWDPIEMIAMLALIVSLVTNHVIYKYQKMIFFLRPTLCVFVITTYFVSRYDILNSIHSFALAAKSQHFIEMKLILLCCTIYINLYRFYKNSNLFITLSITTTLFIVFYYYYVYVLLSILYDICTNVISSLNTTPAGDKFIYINIFLLLCLKIFFNISYTAFFFNVSLSFLLLIGTNSFFIVLLLISLMFTFKNNFSKKLKLASVFYKIVFMHTILLFLMYLLVLYSNVEIFFTKNSTKTYLNKNFVVFVNQQIGIKDYWSQHLHSTRTSTEVFFQKSSGSVKLLAQSIMSNTHFNLNTINLTKIVCFIQNYLYFYLSLVTVLILSWFKKIHKSGIV